MKRFFLLTLFALTLMACGEGRVGLITDDVVTDAAGCYESVEVVDDAYLVSLDKTCVDFALSDFVIESPPVEQGTLPAVRDWALVATLERDIRQKHWHQFYVQEDIEPKILTAYTQGQRLSIRHRTIRSRYWYNILYTHSILLPSTRKTKRKKYPILPLKRLVHTLGSETNFWRIPYRSIWSRINC